MSLATIINTQRQLVSGSSLVSLKFNKTGTVTILNPSFSPTPNKIYINTDQSSYSNTIDIQNINDEIKLEWDNNLNNCSTMFKDLINAVLIDLSYFVSTQVKDTSYVL